MSLSLDTLLLQLLNGVVWGSMIALIALGLSLVFGLVEIINMAHGEFYMLGAVFTTVIFGLSGSFWLALLTVPILMSIFGLFSERWILRRIEHDPPATLIATFGLSMFLQYLVLWHFGGAPRRVAAPWEAVIEIGSLTYPVYRLFVAFISIGCFLLFTLFLNRTRYGLWIRTAGQDSELALALGLPVHRIFWITFGIGTGFAALAGVLAAPIVGVDFKMGLDVLILAFMAAIIGGLGRMAGTFFAGILLGSMESIFAVFLTPSLARLTVLVLVCLGLIWRPHGLFFQKT